MIDTILQPPHRTAPALTDGHVRLNYGDLRLEVARVAGGLTRQGIKAGDVVGVARRLSVETILLELALVHIGATSLPMAWNLHPSLMQSLMRRAGAERVFTSADPTPVGSPMPPVHTVGTEEVAAIMATSGSTGAPKLVPLLWRHVLAVNEQVQRRLSLEPGMRFVSHLPLEHTAERHWTVWGAFAWGLDVRVVKPGGRERALQEHEPHFHFDVPLRWEREAARPGAAPWTRSLRVALSASAPLAPHTLQTLRDRGLPLFELYGMTETTNVFACAWHDPRAGTVGPPLDECEARVVDDELQVRGPNVFDGYLDTPTPWDDGWLRTGDRAVIDELGSIFLHGRVGDTVVTAGGVKVEPAPLEAALRSVPSIAHALVAGTGQPRIVVVLLPSSESALSDAQSVCERVLPPEARPLFVLDVASEWKRGRELTETGKIRRAVLLERYADVIEMTGATA